MISRVTAATIAVGVIAAGLTVAVWQLPFVDYAYRSTNAHAALETAAALVSALAAYLVYWRVRTRAQASDVALTVALALLAATTLVFGALPAALPSLHANRIGTWMPVTGRVAAAAVFVVAAFARRRRLRRPERAVGLAFLASVVLLTTAAVVVHLEVSPTLEVEDRPPPDDVAFTALTHPSVLGAAQLLRFVLYVVAAAGFLRRARTDPFAGWLAVGIVLSAFAAANYYVYPSLYTDWIAFGDVLRLGSYVLLLGAVVGELRRQQAQAAEAVRLRERRRVARDVHDALAQELATIVMYTSDRKTPLEGAELDHVAAAARRALTASRDAIEALAHPRDVPLEVQIAAAVDVAAARSGVPVAVAVEPGIRVDAETREAVVRIVGEAVANAVRHSSASSVDVEVWSGSELHVRVVDDGVGLDHRRPPRQESFGLVAMAERARELGGWLRIHTSSQGGTAVEAVLP